MTADSIPDCTHCRHVATATDRAGTRLVCALETVEGHPHDRRSIEAARSTIGRCGPAGSRFEPGAPS